MDDGIIFKGATGFDEYTVVEERYNNRPARVLYSKARIAAQSGIALDGQSELLFDYNERFMELVRGLKPAGILIIGGGAFTLPSAVMEEFPKTKVDVVEIDEGLVAIAVDYFGFKPSKNTEVYIGDGLAFLQQTDKLYDLIVVDVFVGAALPAAVQSEQFAAGLGKCLLPNGVVAMNIIASLHGSRAATLHRQLDILQPLLPHLQVFPAGHGVSTWLPQNFVLIASKQHQNFGQYLRYKAAITQPRL